MQHTISSLRSMYHFEPLSELALQRYAINPKGEFEFNDDELSSQEVGLCAGSNGIVFWS